MDTEKLRNKVMLDRNEQMLFYSPEEYIRRRNAVITAMKKADVELLIIAYPCEEAYAAWLANDTDCSYLMVDAGGELTLVYGYDFGFGCDFSIYEEKRVGCRAFHDLIPGIRYTRGIDISYVCERAGKNKRVGVINWRYITKGVCDAIEERLPSLEWIDLRIPVSMIRVVRSEEEREAIRHTAEMEEKIFKAAPLFIREGRYPRDVIRELIHYAKELGAGRDELSMFFLECGYENDGGKLPPFNAGMRMIYQDTERIRKGFKLLLMLEMNRYGGLILDTGKTFSIGEPHPVTKRIFEQSVKAQDYVASMMKPGMIPEEIEKEAVRFAKEELGINMLSWNLLHGMGNTKTEAPDLRDSTTAGLPLLENMHLLCEPNTCVPFGDVANPSYSFHNVVIIPNTFLVTQNGGVRTVNIPDEIFVL